MVGGTVQSRARGVAEGCGRGGRDDVSPQESWSPISARPEGDPALGNGFRLVRFRLRNMAAFSLRLGSIQGDVPVAPKPRSDRPRKVPAVEEQRAMPAEVGL